MVPLIKLFSLLIRVFTRPLTNKLKAKMKNKKNHNPYMRIVLGGLGQRYHSMNIRLQRKSMKMRSSYVKPLTEEKALESGTDLIGEMIAYSTLFGWGIYEMTKYAKENRRKESTQRELFAAVHARIDGIEKEFAEIATEIQEIQEILLRKLE